jgi:hypothetical protein
MTKKKKKKKTSFRALTAFENEELIAFAATEHTQPPCVAQTVKNDRKSKPPDHDYEKRFQNMDIAEMKKLAYSRSLHLPNRPRRADAVRGLAWSDYDRHQEILQHEEAGGDPQGAEPNGDSQHAEEFSRAKQPHRLRRRWNEDMTTTELIDVARSRGIVYNHRLSHADLIRSLERSENLQQATSSHSVAGGAAEDGDMVNDGGARGGSARGSRYLVKEPIRSNDRDGGIGISNDGESASEDEDSDDDEHGRLEALQRQRAREKIERVQFPPGDDFDVSWDHYRSVLGHKGTTKHFFEHRPPTAPELNPEVFPERWKETADRYLKPHFQGGYYLGYENGYDDATEELTHDHYEGSNPDVEETTFVEYGDADY